MTNDLATAFTMALPAGSATELPDAGRLGTLLAGLVEQATRPWGQLDLSPAQFVSWLASRIQPADVDPLATLTRLHVADLYLVCACCARSSAAVAILERDLLPQLPPALARLSLSREMVQETLQELRKQLFVPNSPKASAALERYLGRAPLKSWLRAVALRTAMRLLRARTKEVPVEDSFLEEQLAQDGDAELAFLRSSYRPAFRAAFSSALAGLALRHRNLLRQHYIDGITVERLAVMYSVHRVTLSRWIGAARQELAAAVEDELVGALGLRRSECASVVRLCMSRPELTFTSFFAPERGEQQS